MRWKIKDFGQQLLSDRLQITFIFEQILRDNKMKIINPKESKETPSIFLIVEDELQKKINFRFIMKIFYWPKVLIFHLMLAFGQRFLLAYS